MENTVEINSGTNDTSARIAVDRGFNCFSFRVGGHELLDAEEGFHRGTGRPSGHGIPILFPFPNRIRDGRYTWRGQSVRMPDGVAPDDGSGNAIHGFCLDRPWRVVARDASSVQAEFQLSVDAPDRRPLWPTDARISLRYSVEDTGLLADIVIENPGNDDMPFGFGTHPYFRLPLGPAGTAADCRLLVPAQQQWELEACLPSGRVLPVDSSCDLRHNGGRFGDLQLDHVLTGLTNGTRQRPATLDLDIHDNAADRLVRQRCDADLFREVVVYTPPGRDAVCLEPYTCVTDAINIDPGGATTGWAWLASGQRWETRIEIVTGPLFPGPVVD
jgi:aldose 1-epimerase